MINIAVSMVKMKVVAVLLGPAGIGLIGLYMNLVQTAAAITALGIGNVGTRQIATANAVGGELAVGRTRRALFWGTMGLALVGGALFWAISSWIARVILADATLSDDVAWLSLGVALTVAAGSQSALLTGLRRIGDLARVNVASGTLGAVLGVLSVYLWGGQGIVLMLLIAPTASLLLGHIYVSRLGPPAGPPTRLLGISGEFRVMVTLGFPFMLSGLVGMLGHLAVRTLVQRELGPEALGHFQAAWVIGMTYLGFVLGAMGTDYYARLTAVIGDQAAAIRLVNEQTEVALLLCAPVLMAMLGLAPWVIQFLYSPEFAPAVEILRWQLLGDILKVVSWPLGFVLLAAGASRTYMLTETLGTMAYVLCVFVGLPLIGVAATGVAFLALYIAYLPLVWWYGGRRIGFVWARAVKAQAIFITAAALIVMLAARWSDAAGIALGALMSVGLTIWALLRLSSKAEATGLLGRTTAMGDKVLRWLIRR